MRHAVRLGSVRFGSSEGEIVSLELSIKLQKSLNKASLDVTSFLERVARRESEASD